MKSIVLILLAAGFAHAHHGQDFFVTLDARIPGAGHASTFGTAAAGDSSFSLETGFLAGLGSGLAAGASIDFNDDGSFHGAGLTPFLQWSAPLGESALRLGATLSWYFHDSSRTPVGGAHSHGGHSHGGHSHRRPGAGASFGNPIASASGFNPDAPPPPTPGGGSSAPSTDPPSSIHLHDTDHFLARVVVEYEFDASTRCVGNLILGGTSGNDLALGYALAVRRELTPRWALGLEAIGDFNTHGYHQIVAGVIHNPRHDLGLRLGIGHGIGPGAEGSTLLFGLTRRF